MPAVKKRKKGKGKKIIIGVLILLVVVVLVAKNFTKNGKVDEIETTKVKIGNVVNRLTETGNIELLRTVEVKSKIAGTVSTILVIEGEAVTKDQILCVIDPDPSQMLILLQKRSSVDRSRINLDQANKEVTRMRELAKTALVSTKDLEDSENAYLMAQNNFNLAVQELEIMEKEIETTGSGAVEKIVASKVRAPYDGYITQRYIEEGDIVTSGMSSVVAGTNLFQIGDPSTKIIKANISEVDIGRVAIAAKVDIILDAYPDTSFAGQIRHISPVGSLQQGRNVVTFKTEIEIIDKDPRLKPGMSCDVDVLIASAENVTYLPLETVYEKREGSEEDGDETITTVMYVKKEAKEDGEPKKKNFFKKEKIDPYAQFEERTVEMGIKSESRAHIITAVDTSLVVAADAEKFYDELEKKKDEDEKDNKKKKNKVTTDAK